MLTKNDLIEWLKRIDNKLNRDITLTAVGGTALVLLNLKESTIDVDFDIKKEDYDLFKKLSEGEFKVDLFIDGYIFSEQLPENYVKLSENYTADFKHITLKILDPIDIIITKSARYNARDEEDIALLAKNFKIDKIGLLKRFETVVESYAGSESIFRDNFNIVLKRHFPQLK